MSHTITFASTKDAKELLAIYTPYVKETTISFEYEPPTVLEFANRIETISKNYPYLIYKINGEIVGYAYASTFKTRTAFMWDVETSIYVKPEYHQAGIAKKLYDVLLPLLEYQGFYKAYAYICIPNNKSVGFHEKFGFTHGAIYKNTGFKLNTWCDLLCMEKELRQITSETIPVPYTPITQVPTEVIDDFIKQVIQ